VALLFCDGFDHYAVADLHSQGYSANDNTNDFAMESSIKVTGTQSLKMGNADTDYVERYLPERIDTFIMGFAMNWTSITNHDGYQFGNETGMQVTVEINDDFSISIKRGSETGTLLESSDPNTIITGEWQYLEMKATIHDTTGSYEIRLDETPIISGENVDTKAQTTDGITRFRLKGADSQHYIDDLYFCDDSGSYNNDFLGERQVDTIYPTAVGTYSQMSPSGEVNNWQCVKDLTYDLTNNRVASSGELIDTYVFSGLTELLADDINAVVVSAASRRYHGGVAKIAAVSRVDSIDYSGEFRYVRTDIEHEKTVFERNPSGEVQWTYDAVNGGEFGIKQSAG